MSDQARILKLEKQARESQLWPVTYGGLVAQRLALPGLVGCWPMSSVQRSTGNVYDLSGQGRTLTYNGNGPYSYTDLGVPYAEFDGTGDYLSLADSTDIDILGTETIYAAATRGLTLYTWVYFDNLSSDMGVLSKWNNTGNQRGYLLWQTSDVFQFFCDLDGTGASADSVSSSTIAAGQWYGVACVFVPSTSMTMYIVSASGLETVTNTTGILASIFNNTAALQLGAHTAGTFLLDGRQSLTSLYANNHSAALVRSVLNQERVLFGV